jgi:protocatechuate 3,4-dioxygenase beta subunit
MEERHDRARRRFVAGMLTAGAAGLAAPYLSPPAAAQNSLQPTPACDDGDEPAPPQTEGSFFTPNSPLRASLRESARAGTPIVLTGFVLTRSCRPLANALVDLWHADDAGAYDNEGYRLRGHQFTDAAGRYAFGTIVPGLYPGRTRHFHIKYQAAGQPVLTTQLYFPGEPDNERDGIFHPALVMQVSGGTARFDAVLDVG